MSTILDSDATSYLGRNVVQQLLSQPQGHSIIALVRNLDRAADLAAEGAILREGGYNDYASLVAAFQGVDKLYIVSSNDVYAGNGDMYNSDINHENILRAAQKNGVKHVFYPSYQRNSDNGSPSEYLQTTGQLQAEHQVRESGLPYTLLKHALYTELLPELIGKNVLKTGTIFLPAGNGRASFATCWDIALAGAILLLQTEPVAESYEIASPQSYSMADVAAILSELAGKPVRYVSPTADEFVEQLSGSGQPAEGYYAALGLCQVIEQGKLDCPNPTPTLAQLLGREPESVKSYLKQAFDL